MANIRHTEEAKQYLEDTIFPITRTYGLPDSLVASQWAVEGGGIKDNPQHNLFGLGGVDHFMSFPTLKDGIEYYANTVIRILKDKGYDIEQMKDDPVAIVQALQDPKGPRYEGHNLDPNTYVWTITNTPEWRENGGTEYSPTATPTPTIQAQKVKNVLGAKSSIPTWTPEQEEFRKRFEANVEAKGGRKMGIPIVDAQSAETGGVKGISTPTPTPTLTPLKRNFFDWFSPKVMASNTTMTPAPSNSMQGTFSKPQQYSVQPGDTLYGISQRYLGSGDRWRELSGYGGNPRQMPVGTRITVPQQSTPYYTATSAKTGQPISTSAPSQSSYSPQVSTPANANASSIRMGGATYIPPRSQSNQVSRSLSQPKAQQKSAQSTVKSIINAITNLFKPTQYSRKSIRA